MAKTALIYEGKQWKHCVETYRITADQLRKQFGMPEERAREMADGKITVLPDNDDVKRLAAWYAMEAADVAKLNQELDVNWKRGKKQWFTSIQEKLPSDISDEILGQRWRDKHPLKTKKAPVADMPQADAEKPANPIEKEMVKTPAIVATAVPQAGSATAEKKSDATPPETTAASPASFVQKIHRRGRPPRVAHETDPKEFSLEAFKDMTIYKQVDHIITKSGLRDAEVAQKLDVNPERIKTWRHNTHGNDQRYRPHPAVVELMIRELNVEPAYAEAIRVTAAIKSRGNFTQQRPNHKTQPPEHSHEREEPDAFQTKGEEETWKPLRQPIPEFDREIRGSAAAHFLIVRSISPTPRSLAAQIDPNPSCSDSRMKRAKAILQGGVLKEPEIKMLKHHLGLSDVERHRLRGPGVAQLLKRRNISLTDEPLANWLGDGNGQAVTEERVGQIMNGAPLNETEIAILKTKLATQKKKLTNDEITLLQSQPGLSQATPVQASLPAVAQEPASAVDKLLLPAYQAMTDDVSR